MTSPRTSRRSPAVVAALGTLVCVGAVTGLSQAGGATAPAATSGTSGTTTVVSSSSAGTVGNRASALVDAVRGMVGFDSTATNLSPAATSGVRQSYVKATSGALTLVSSTATAQGSSGIGFSPDGGRYAFVARRGLTGTAAGPQAYVRTLASGAVALVSGTGSTPLANSGLSVTPAGFSSTGNRLAFAARDTSYGAGWQVLVKDLGSGALTLASVTSSGAPISSAAEAPPTVAVAPDGSAVYFDTDAPRVVAKVAAGQVYRRDLAAAVTSAVSRDASGSPCRGTLDAVLATGKVVFDSPGICAAGLPRAKGNVFVTGPTGAGTAVVSASSSGSPSDGLSAYGAASPDGSLVAFTSFGTTLGVAGVLSTTPQIYVKNLGTGALTWVSRPPSGGNTGKNVSPTRAMQFASDGGSLVFPSHATNLVSPAPTVPQVALRRDLTAGRTTVVSLDAAGSAVDSPFVRVVDAGRVAFTDDTAGQVLLRVLP
ncbi:MAG: hypothetical protein M3Y71_17175 [Actinomycetota bacterium]|nr:hypothetical protein [Actinomycetota bacterium]